MIDFLTKKDFSGYMTLKATFYSTSHLFSGIGVGSGLLMTYYTIGTTYTDKVQEPKREQMPSLIQLIPQLLTSLTMTMMSM